MKNKITLAMATLGSALMFSNCAQNSSPTDFNADFGQTGNLPIATSDCKVICARAEGSSQGIKLFNLIPLKSASETEAIKNMYKNAQSRGARIEGESRFFVNKGMEVEKRNMILFSIEKLKASGDLVQYMSDKPVAYSAVVGPKGKVNSGGNSFLSWLPFF